MVRKNWTQIAMVRSEQIRHALIAANAEDSEKLSKAYPECFLPEGAPAEPISYRNLMGLLVQARHRDDVLHMVKDLGLPYERISFAGHCNGAVEGVSYSDGGYQTVRNGYGANFYLCSKKQGEVVKYRDTNWMVVWNVFRRGDAHTFDTHTLVLVPGSAIEGMNRAALDAFVEEMNSRMKLGR